MKPEVKPVVWQTPEKLEQQRERAEGPGTGSSGLAASYSEWRKLPGDPGTRQELLKRLEPTINAALTSFVGQDNEDYRTKASIMALDAAGTYDPAKNVKLNTYVMNHLQGLRRLKAERSGIVHIPENVRLEQHSLWEAGEAYKAEHGREPSAEELADATGISVKRMQKIRAYKNQVPEATLLMEKGDSLFTRQEDPQRIWADYVYYDLDPVNKKIFEWCTGYGGSEKLKKIDIARRLGISPPAVSQRINKIVAKLEQGYNV